jgi:mono/diheme cytochrome c family protein
MSWRHVVAAGALLAASAGASAQTPVERGRYLVEGILTCGNCHSPRGPGGVVDAARLYSGGPQTWDEPTYTVKGSNITPDPETGIGKWNAGDIKKALQAGVRPNGTQLAPIMPYPFYKIFTSDDLDAVTAYIQSAPPVRNEVPTPVYKAALHIEPVPGADKPISPGEMANPIKRGFYLVTIGHCMECHTPVVNDRPDFSRMGAGGRTFVGPFGESVSRNITSHKEKGIGSWTDADVKRAITKGVRKDGTPLKPPMGYDWYARMTDADLDAVVAYLRTVPPKE